MGGQETAGIDPHCARRITTDALLDILKAGILLLGYEILKPFNTLLVIGNQTVNARVVMPHLLGNH